MFGSGVLALALALALLALALSLALALALAIAPSHTIVTDIDHNVQNVQRHMCVWMSSHMWVNCTHEGNAAATNVAASGP